MNDASFYNTTHLRGQELRIREIQAKHQEDRVLEFARDNPAVKFSPEDLVRILPGTPRTSRGRCCTNLQDAGELERLGEAEMVMGEYGMKIHVYRLAKPTPQEPVQDGLF